MEVRLDPSHLRKIMDLVQNEENYYLFKDVSHVEPPDESFVKKDVDFITIIARSTKTLPYGILILFESETGTFKIEALWPEDFAVVCQKTPKILDTAVKALIERPEDFLGVSVYSIRKK